MVVCFSIRSKLQLNKLVNWLTVTSYDNVIELVIRKLTKNVLRQGCLICQALVLSVSPNSVQNISSHFVIYRFTDHYYNFEINESIFFFFVITHD